MCKQFSFILARSLFYFLASVVPFSDAWSVSLKENSPLLSNSNKTSIQAQFTELYSKIPMHFEANKGQADDSVKFLAQGLGYNLFLTSTDAVMSFKNPRPEQAKQYPLQIISGTKITEGTAIKMQLLGARSISKVIGLKKLPGKVNYFSDNNPANWHPDISTYAKVKYQKIYPGIDLVYYGNQKQLEYDFIVYPGADPKKIKLGFAGINENIKPKLYKDNNGDLIVSIDNSEIRWHKPVAYQERSGKRIYIDGNFVLDKSEVSFNLAAYDKNKTLVIDPVLVYSTFLGGGDKFSVGGDWGNGIAIDRLGNTYVTGRTNNDNFPTKNAFQPGSTRFGSAFVSKFTKTGALVYSTYLGTNNTQGNAIAVDINGQAHVTGFTAGNFPTKKPLQSFQGLLDAFVVKLSKTGSALIFSTYLGDVIGDDAGQGIALDTLGNIFVTGKGGTNEGDPTVIPNTFPIKNAIQKRFGGHLSDAFVTKLNKNGSAIIYSTWLGGGKDDQGTGIAVDSKNNALITGWTDSDNFPTISALQNVKGGSSDSFIAKINASGTSLTYSTYLGGFFREKSYGIAVDKIGNAYITGVTGSGDFPTKKAFRRASAGNDDAFVSKVNPSGALLFSTYLGGKNNDEGHGIAVDKLNQVYLTGWTISTNFPIKNALQKVKSNFTDVFITKFSPAGTAIVYSTYFGGKNVEEGNAISVDINGQAYVTGRAASSNFPTKNAFQKGLVGQYDAFVMKLSK